jgi:hypothetical protein
MSKAIQFAGVSRVNGVLKFRTAVNPARIAQLGRLGDTDVEFANVNAETKSAAAKDLLSRNFANGRADIEALLVAVAADDTPFRAPRARTVTVTVPTRFAQEMLGEQVQVSRGVYGRVFPEIAMTPRQAEKIRNEFNAKHKEAA